MNKDKSDKFKYEIFPRVLSRKECNSLISKCIDFKISRTTNRVVSNEEPYRKALTAVFPSEPYIISKLRKRFAKITNSDIEQQETPISVIKYSEGDYYLPHFDFFGGVSNLPHSEAGDRLFTGIVYLNDDYEGGETKFVSEEVSIKAKQGDLLVWTNLNRDGTPNRNTKHSGLPITKGNKFIVVIWAREKKIGLIKKKTLF